MGSLTTNDASRLAMNTMNVGIVGFLCIKIRAFASSAKENLLLKTIVGSVLLVKILMNGKAMSDLDFQFYRGKTAWKDKAIPSDHNAAVRSVVEAISETVGAKNLSFLIGAGCSSHWEDSSEIMGDGKSHIAECGIPTMGPLAKEFIPETLETSAEQVIDQSDANTLKTIVGIDVSDDEYRDNLERLMEVIHATRFMLEKSKKETELTEIEKIISKLTKFIVNKCLSKTFRSEKNTVRQLYRQFYRKLVYRDRSLPRPWVFTTNYDLFSEMALDDLGIVFCNGFSGVVNRRFNPATYKYALAEQLDVSSKKWTTVDNYIYLCKLHGSINWIADETAGIHRIREIQSPLPEQPGDVMIFPTPQKHHATLASPYTDLFREFQSQIVREQSVLITMGYSFGDEHINTIIHQALTVPTFRLVVFGDPSVEHIKKLIELDDPRI